MPFIEDNDENLSLSAPRPKGSHPVPSWADLMRSQGYDPELIRKEAMKKMKAEALQDARRAEQTDR